jgi:3-methyl-2-oxobutanoate hydroxymethyltransferase
VKTTTQTITLLKEDRPIVAVTAYDSVVAHYADEAGVDLILVGDSVGTTQLGFETTIPVTLDMMLHHTAAVVRAKPNALVVADVPFAVAHGKFSDLLNACVRLMQEAGAEAVKIECNASMAPVIKRLIQAGIPVLAHIGLLPQQFHRIGGYRRVGRTEAEKVLLVEDALALEKAGCFALICEMVEDAVAGAIAQELNIPLIGIGSGPHCDGQILVSNDLLGLTTGKVPSFVKQYAPLGEEMKQAFVDFSKDVRNVRYPK